MIYAEFQVKSTGWNGKDYTGPVEPVPMLGSDGTYRLDGRKTRPRQIQQARQRAKSMNGDKINAQIIGVILYSAPNGQYSDGKAITAFIPVE